jgi:outer membrane protein OmpA-like peptidoglycan-associated protein
MVTQPVWLLLCAVIALSACSASQTTDVGQAQMHIHIASAESQLLSLEQQRSRWCISGQLAIAQSYLTRATTEHNANMDNDAFISLVEFDRQIRKIHCINQYINRSLGCGYSNKKVILKRWYDEGDFNQCENPGITKQKKDDKEGSVVENEHSMEEKHILITETLHDFDEENIKPIYFPSLNKLIQMIKSYPNSTLLIKGHTDSTGSSAYNHNLSKRRAQSVANYFTEQGIQSSKIEITHQGETNIRQIEKNDDSRVFNRYTTITLILDTSSERNI